LAARQGSPGMLIAFPSALTPRMSANLGLFRTRAPGARPSRHCGVPTLVKGLPFTAGRALHCRLNHTLNVTGLTTGYIRQAWRALGGRAFDQRSACRRSREGAYPTLAVSAADMELDAWFSQKKARPGNQDPDRDRCSICRSYSSSTAVCSISGHLACASLIHFMGFFLYSAKTASLTKT